MSSNDVKVNGAEVATDISKPMVLNININKPSALYSMIESTKSAWKGPKPSQAGTKATAAPFRGEQKVLGAVQIMSGLVCVSLAVIFCFYQEDYIVWTGSGFWTGFPFILAGAVSIVSEKRTSRYWLCVASLMNWISLSVSVAGIAIIASDFSWFPWWQMNPEYFCNPRSDGYSGHYYNTTTLGPKDWRMKICMNVFGSLMSLYIGMKIMLLVATCLALCIAIYSLGYGCKTLCCTPTPEQQEKDVMVGNDKKPMLTRHPSPHAEKPPKMETV